MAKIISSDLVIGNALIEIKKEIINFDEIVDYDKTLSEKLEGTDYYSKGVGYYSIMEFCCNYSYFAKADFENSQVILKANNEDFYKRMNRHFRIGLPDVVFAAMKRKNNKDKILTKKYQTKSKNS